MFVVRDGARLFCQVAGQGEPSLVFIQGVGTGHEAWRDQVPYFAAARKVVAVDLRGHGQSDAAADYPQELFIADLQAVLAANQLAQPVLVGWSLGGSIAIRFAALYPERIAALVLVDHSVRAIRTDDNPLGAEPGLIEGMLRDVEEDYPGRGVRSLVDRWFSEPEEEVQNIKQWLYKLCLRTDPEVILKIRRRGIREDRSGWLSLVKAPTLILQGGASQLGGEATGWYQHREIANSILHIFPGRGHALHLTAPGEFRARVEQFLNTLPSPPIAS
jgi:pimeloyl-ACP methyl ester carboxylesterase